MPTSVSAGTPVAPLEGAALARTLQPPAAGSIVLRGCFSGIVARFIGVYEPSADSDVVGGVVLTFTQRLHPTQRSDRAAMLSRRGDGTWHIEEEWTPGLFRTVLCTTTTDHGTYSPLTLQVGGRAGLFFFFCDWILRLHLMRLIKCYAVCSGACLGGKGVTAWRLSS